MTISSLNAVTVENDAPYLTSSQYNAAGKFTNQKMVDEFSFSRLFRIVKRSLFEKKQNTAPDKLIPLESISDTQLEQLPSDKTSIIRLGHSTILLKLDKQFWLIDPVFSERASPFSFMGPKRFHQPPISINDLPEIDGVIISHNHYDHLDEYSIKQLANKVKHFIMPLGNSAQVIDWGINPDKVTELDWWQSIQIEGTKITATPAQHFSGRGISDRNKTLWSSWVIKSESSNLFFSGDTGYFDGFKEIGNQYGPFDLTMLETGAYDKDWSEVHMSPTESAQAHKDLKGKKLLPIHNGTFDLAFHSWTDPFEQMVEIANRDWIDLLTPKMGQVVTLNNDDSVDAARDLFWWR
ncbi:MBL fold metallo-hydrolase [Aliikangiella coralliicola]|uniref:MBL fold metallo-hydrolase n=2 Tax=Aliikangiella coralliicola TaxID=2592383 RepID=A0A545UK92_9GAMM|nr:MBL fold metallo-hydrolase [Aliikangiella coralliicola]